MSNKAHSDTVFSFCKKVNSPVTDYVLWERRQSHYDWSWCVSAWMWWHAASVLVLYHFLRCNSSQFFNQTSSYWYIISIYFLKFNQTYVTFEDLVHLFVLSQLKRSLSVRAEKRWSESLVIMSWVWAFFLMNRKKKKVITKQLITQMNRREDLI